MPGCGVHLYCFIDSLVYCFSNYQLARNSPIEPRDEMECTKKQGAEALYYIYLDMKLQVRMEMAEAGDAAVTKL